MTALSITPLSTKAFCIDPLMIIALSIKVLHETKSINETQHNNALPLC